MGCKHGMAKANEKAAHNFLNAQCTLVDNMTWRDWMCDILTTLVHEGEGFSGKRPNCDSGWATELADALHKNGMPCVENDTTDWEKVDKHFKLVCKAVFYPK